MTDQMTLRLVTRREQAGSKLSRAPFIPRLSRTNAKLAPIVDTLTADTEIMQRLRAAIVSKDEKSGREAIRELIRRAQALDVSIKDAEGTRMLLMLSKRIKTL